jgi:RHS repeat-associated protein
MTTPRLLRPISLCLLLLMLAGLLPIQPAAAQKRPVAAAAELVTPAPEKIYAPGVKDERTPSLTLDIQVSASTLNVGDSATISLVVHNQAAFPATNVVVSLPLPAGATPAGTANFNAASGAWQWTIERIDGRTSHTVSAPVTLRSMPAGAALLARPSVIAAELALPVSAVGGALVAEPAAAGTAAFTPGKAASLRAGDNRVEVRVPADLTDEGLQLSYRTLAEKRQQSKRFQAPPATVGFKPGLATFFLDATDATGQPVHTFQQPLTISVRYTPEQLLALGIAEADLTVFWYDEAARQWVPQPTTVDPASRTASVRVDHFSAYALGDGSSPSEAFIPALKAWQVGLYSGSANYSLPIEVPAGAGGLKPNLELSYASTASDGKGGMRRTQQAGWVGKGWSLDTGSVAFNKASVYSNQYNHYSVVMNGMSFDLVRAEATAGNTGPSDPDPTHWAWRPTDENFVKVRVVANGVSTGSRGGFQTINSVTTAKPRHTWQVWTKDGTRYDFAEDLWWGWDNCAASNSVDMETYKWQLTQIVDVHGNAITYSYARDSHTGTPLSCDWTHSGQGTVDRDSWPTAITWGGHFNAAGVRDAADRYKVEFVSSVRAADTQFEGAENQYGAANGTAGWGHVRETRRLDLVRVLSMPASAWEVVREYQFGYDYSLLSDYSINTGGVYSADAGTPKLTLKNITRVGKYDAPITPASPIGTPGTPNTRPGLPPMLFTYGTARGLTTKAYPSNGDWNRLTTVNNGQGGTVSFAYETIEAASSDPVFRNNRRVTSKTTTDGRGNSASWTYAYTAPAANWLGYTLTGRTKPDPVSGLPVPAEPNNPNSATLYYAKKAVSGHDYTSAAEAYTAAMPYTQFRGHASVVETAPDGTKTEHYYYQGDVGCNPAAGAINSHAAIIADACFIQLRDREILKGKEYRTVVRTAAGALMTQTDHTFAVNFLDYTYLPIRGQWRAFTYESETSESNYEGGATPLIKRTTYAYDPAFQGGTQYGNLTHTHTYDASNVLYRSTINNYLTNVSSAYIVDRKIQEVVRDGGSNILALTARMYDGATTSQSMGARGLLTLVRKYFNIPAGITSTTGLTLNSSDTSYGYDVYGNRTSVTTYAASGTRTNGGGTFSAPGNGSAAATTTTVYDDPATTTVDEAPWGLSLKEISPTINGVTLSEQAGYDLRMGTLTSVTDPNGNVTAAQYDVFGRLERVIKPGDTVALPTIRAEYGDTDLPFRYTTFKRIESGVSGSVQRASQFYDGLGQKIQTKTESINNAQSVVVDTRYNGMGQVFKTAQPRFLPDTDLTIAQYTNTQDPDAVWTTHTYDAVGRELTLTTPDGAQTRHVYAINGNMLMDNTIDPNRHRVQHGSDVFGRLAQVVEIKGTCGNYWGYACAAGETVWVGDATTTYAYSPLDLLTSVTDAQNNVTTMTYDSLGRKLTMSDPDMGAWTYAYDVDGNLVTQTDAKNQTLAFTYDALNRLTQKYDPSGAKGGLNVSYGYDELDSEIHTNGRGQRTSMVDASGGQHWGYDERGQVVRETQTINDQGLGYMTDIYRSFYANGLLKTLTYPTGETLSYVYNDAGQQLAISSSLGGSFLSDASYDALGQKLLEKFGNAVDTTYTYDATSKRLANISATGIQGTVFQRAYSYDPAGNVRTIANPLGSETLRYAYDDRDRLTAACAVSGAASPTCLGGSTFNQAYAYDKIGNLTSKAGVAYTYPTNGVRPHAVSTVGGAAQSYDNNGNLLSGGGRSYTWNVENQPTQIVSGATTETYAYNGDNQRVKKVSVSGGVTTTTRYVGGVVEYVTGNKVVSSYDGIAVRTSVGTPSVTNQGTIVYLHSDHLGSVSVTTTGGGGIATWGNIVQAQNFDPWGAVRSGGITATEFNYTGQRKDAGTGLLFYNARYYDPALARFTQADSIVPGTAEGNGGEADSLEYDESSALRPLTVDFHERSFVEGLNKENDLTLQKGFWFQLSAEVKQDQDTKQQWGPQNAQALNRYTYVLNNPLRYIDPSGHDYCIRYIDKTCVVRWIDTPHGERWAEIMHEILGWGALIPIGGRVFAAADAGIYFVQGKYVMAAWTMFGGVSKGFPNRLARKLTYQLKVMLRFVLSASKLR